MKIGGIQILLEVKKPEYLTIAPPRLLSPLEKYAVGLAFDGAVNPDGPTVEIIEREKLNLGGGKTDFAAGSHTNGMIQMARCSHRHTDNMTINSTVDNTDLRKPSNIAYLARLVHESAHYWQWIHQCYPNSMSEYTFDREALRGPKFVGKEQHASAAQVYFILKWQLHHGHDPINLTNKQSGEEDVGPVNRFTRIRTILHNDQGQRLISREFAQQIADMFDDFLVDLN